MDTESRMRLQVDVDYGQFYVFDAAGLRHPGGDDFFDDPWLWERRCTSIGSAAIILTLAQHGPTPVEVVAIGPARSDADLAAWDHVAEMSLSLPSGRLGVQGWDGSGPVHELGVPPGTCIVRVHWGGLDAAVARNDETLEHLRLETRPAPPGPPSPARVLRAWPRWTPESHERTASNGLRLFVGAVALQRQADMTAVNLGFWGDNPITPDGTVSQLWRDPESGHHFASGYTPQGHRMLRELTADEVAEIIAAGDPHQMLFFEDEDGHIWTTQLPMRRTTSMDLIPPQNWEMIRSMGRPEDEPQPLPPGWERIVRSTLAEPEPTPIDAVGEPEPGVLYRRLRS